jgi:hypothetical protein
MKSSFLLLVVHSGAVLAFLASSGFAVSSEAKSWAFKPIPHVGPPADAQGWSANVIDCFLQVKWRASGLQPVAEADKRTLIRRVTFDLIGLPPTPEEVDAFLADTSPLAWPRLISCAGTLNGKFFGPPVVPPLTGEELTGLFDSRGKWAVTKDAGEHTRRSVYVLERRTFLYPLLASFDPPEVMTSCPRRMQTVVPAQALSLLNSPLAREQAMAFARRLLRECGKQPEHQVARAWRLALGRPVTPSESSRAVSFLRKRAAAVNSEAALVELCLALFNTNEFVYVD